MRKLLVDEDFLPKEEKRLNKLLSGKLNKDKKVVSVLDRLDVPLFYVL